MQHSRIPLRFGSRAKREEIRPASYPPALSMPSATRGSRQGSHGTHADSGKSRTAEGLAFCADGLAAIWSVPLVGIAAPRVVVFTIGFVALTTSVPARMRRAVALAVGVPMTAGVLLGLQAPREQQRGAGLVPASGDSHYARVVRGILCLDPDGAGAPHCFRRTRGLGPALVG